MRVTVSLPDGQRVQGAHVQIEIDQAIVLGILVPPYERTVTTDSRGEAIFPNPGIMGINANADISTEVTIEGRKYTYYGAVQADSRGAFPASYPITLSRERQISVENVWIQALNNIKWIAGAAAVVAGAVVVRNVINQWK